MPEQCKSKKQKRKRERVRPSERKLNERRREREREKDRDSNGKKKETEKNKVNWRKRANEMMAPKQQPHRFRLLCAPHMPLCIFIRFFILVIIINVRCVFVSCFPSHSFIHSFVYLIVRTFVRSYVRSSVHSRSLVHTRSLFSNSFEVSSFRFLLVFSVWLSLCFVFVQFRTQFNYFKVTQKKHKQSV